MAKNKQKYLCFLFISIALFVGAILILINIKKSSPIVPETLKPSSNASSTNESQIVSNVPIAVPNIINIGFSVQNRPLEAYIFGNGPQKLLFIGGIHGGYEWNTVFLAYQFIDYFTQNINSIPSQLSLIIIPAANPDGIYKITQKNGRISARDIPVGDHSSGRLNAHNVDLNRNFDCNWQPTAVWQDKNVSAGTTPFSEPETASIRDYILTNHPIAVIFWHSKSGTVYGSSCDKPMLNETTALMNAYAQAASYQTAPTFTNYQVSGDATDWLAKLDIPAITVELATHESSEWNQNLAGVKAILDYYQNK